LNAFIVTVAMEAQYSRARSPRLRGEACREAMSELRGRTDRRDVAREQEPRAHGAVVLAARAAVIGVAAHRAGR
jgi:hypothetical protein